MESRHASTEVHRERNGLSTSDWQLCTGNTDAFSLDNSQNRCSQPAGIAERHTEFVVHPLSRNDSSTAGRAPTRASRSSCPTLVPRQFHDPSAHSGNRRRHDHENGGNLGELAPMNDEPVHGGLNVRLGPGDRRRIEMEKPAGTRCTRP